MNKGNSSLIFGTLVGLTFFLGGCESDSSGEEFAQLSRKNFFSTEKAEEQNETCFKGQNCDDPFCKLYEGNSVCKIRCRSIGAVNICDQFRSHCKWKKHKSCKKKAVGICWSGEKKWYTCDDR